MVTDYGPPGMEPPSRFGWPPWVRQKYDEIDERTNVFGPVQQAPLASPAPVPRSEDVAPDRPENHPTAHLMLCDQAIGGRSVSLSGPPPADRVIEFFWYSI